MHIHLTLLPYKKPRSTVAFSSIDRGSYASTGKKLLSGVLACLPPTLQRGWLDDFSKISRSRTEWERTTVINTGIFNGVVLIAKLVPADDATNPGYLQFSFRAISDGESLPFWVGEFSINFLVKPVESSILKGIEFFNQRWTTEINKILNAENTNSNKRSSLVQQFGRYACPQSAIVKQDDVQSRF